MHEAFAIARRAGALTILNPAPAPSKPLPEALLKHVSILTPNETELERLLPSRKGASLRARAEDLRKKGPAVVIVTYGGRGVWVFDARGGHRFSAFKVRAVDTVGAGDAFNGALAAALAEGMPLDKAVSFAQAAAALSVQRRGAQPSFPRRSAVLRLCRMEEKRFE